MAQADGVVANGTGSAVRADINGQLAALFTNHSGSTEPATTFAFQTWADTNTSTLKLRNSSNDGWIQLARLDGQFDAKTFNGNITLNAQSDLRLADSDSSNWVAFQAPATVASNVTWTLPAADGTSGQTLQTNGSGTLSWSTPSATVDKIEEGNTSAEVVDTGSDGHFKVITEGTEAMRITAAQRVGINTTSPGLPLDIVSDSSSETVRFRGHTTGTGTLRFTSNDGATNYSYIQSRSTYLDLGTDTSIPLLFTTAGTERARIDNSGRLLVGTSSARTNFDFYGVSIEPRIQYEGTSNDFTCLSLTANSTTDSVSGQLRFAKSGADGIGNNGAVVNNEVLGRINFSGSTGSTFYGGAEIIGVCDGTPSTRVPTRLMFYTGGATTDPAERMRISSGGYVEIGQVGGPSGAISTTGFRFMEGNGFWWSTTGANSYWNVNVQTYLRLRYNGGESGSIVINNGSVSYNSSSDYRIKENVVDLDGAITRLKQLEPKRFNFIATPERTVDGFLAHEVQTVVPEAITGIKDQVEVWTADDKLPDGVSVGDDKLDEDGNTIPVYQGIDQAKLVPLLTAALQEAIGRIETLEAKVAALEGV